MPHLNELQEEFGDRGLTIIGVTDEGASQTEEFVEKNEVRYPFAYYSGRDLPRFAGVEGIPHAILVDPTGQVVWAGHPAGLRGSVVEQYLEGALPMPLFAFPKDARKVEKAFEKEEWAEALEEARELVADGVEGADAILSAIEAHVAMRVARVKAAHAEGDYLSVVERGEPLARGLDDLPEAAEIEALLEEIDDSDEAQEIIAAQEKLRDLRAKIPELKKRRDADKLLDELDDLIADVPGSFPARQATELRDWLKTARLSLR